MLQIKLKNVISFFLILTIFTSAFSMSTHADASEVYNFAEFSETDSMEFVENNNIEIPEKLLNSDILESFTRDIILQAYNHPNVPFSFNYGETQKYAEAIRVAVQSHLNPSGIPSAASTTTYTLQYNKVKNSVGNWVTSGGYYNPKWHNYNCYAYSINRVEQPEFYDSAFQYQPGDMCGEGDFANCDNINQLASIVVNDLIAMGYSSIITTTSIPSVNSSQELICVRMSNTDYHFMHYDMNTNAWYHKPGRTAVLKYNNIPSNNLIWYSEVSYLGEEYSSGFEYDSDIIFIKYSKKTIDVSTSGTQKVTIKPGKDTLKEIIFSNTGYYKIELSSPYDFEYEIYDNNFNVISSGESNNISAYLSAIVGKYYLRMNFKTNTTKSSYVNVNITQHTHSYENYTYFNYSTHKGTCACGKTDLSAHYIRRSDIVNGRYAKCLGCGRMLDLQQDTAVIDSLAITQVTVNGSCVLANGFIILEDIDIEAYLNGTLMFYDSNNIPELE